MHKCLPCSHILEECPTWTLHTSNNVSCVGAQNRVVGVWILDKRAPATFGGGRWETVIELCKKEASALTRLKHPSIVKVYTLPYLTLPYLTLPCFAWWLLIAVITPSWGMSYHWKFNMNTCENQDFQYSPRLKTAKSPNFQEINRWLSDSIQGVQFACKAQMENESQISGTCYQKLTDMIKTPGQQKFWYRLIFPCSVISELP